ncbi:nucleoside binding-domain containing protein Yvo D [Desulfocucumis palustris]|uniref:Nucleoside binding-domain containing protein Yvo D n=1 Tax=Desulfocucumis palustris TaxID=1898651 RepID=A0A2L2XF96_9FIRM|nr:nucleoside recognition domain-containing protein [Desulfocucumis palustris]GBF35017.1 nucleoside binding-domain containing protein Yvo D [Desulfocucumis palustris]
MDTVAVLKRGMQKGLQTMWALAKVIVPVYVGVTFLKHTPLMEIIANFFEPFMSIFGLPGEASVALVLGNLLNIYAALGAISSLDLSAKAITTIAAMLLISHSLLIESAVSARTGVSAVTMTVFRLSLSLAAGVLLNIML